MKNLLLLFFMMLGDWALTPATVAQDIQSGAKLTRAEKKAFRQKSEAESISRVNDLIAKSDFVLVPNQISGNGMIVPWEQSNISIGAESFDLTGFPWYTNPIGVRWVDR